jgi:hypothetical protein
VGPCADDSGADSGDSSGGCGGEPRVLSFLRRHALEAAFVRIDDGGGCGRDRDRGRQP